MLGLDLGDVPTWFGAALSAAVLLTGILLFRKQTEVLNHTIDSFRRSQIETGAGLCVWKAMDDGGIILVIWNTTGFPVTEVKVWTQGSAGAAVWVAFSTVFPPGEREELQLPSHIDPADIVVAEFTDSFGIRWQRTPKSLTRVS